MLYSLLIKLGMFAMTMGVVFWIGWTLPTSFDRDHDLSAESLEGSKAEVSSAEEEKITVSPSTLTSLAGQRPTTSIPKRPPQGLLDLNRATEKDFDALPGIGPQLAERIMKYRQSVGAFQSPDELRAVKGVGKKKFEKIRPMVTVTPDGTSIHNGKKAT
ncbi:MAG TPA: helix-hairpin-helix domain-containing protein [Nitrospiraceae bacterium]|nr:helix-hairpin-helix domain-containing protein [Nitrospiraceae bacterium]